MHEVMRRAAAWLEAGESVAMATVVRTWGSSPRPVGSKMAVSTTGRIEGSVSGGCVEGAVAGAAQQVLASGTPVLLDYGVSNDRAWEVGLSCGGSLEVFVEKLDREMLDPLMDCLTKARLVALATAVGEKESGRHLLIWPAGETLGDLGSPRLNQRASLYAEQMLAALTSSRKSFDVGGGTMDVFFEVFAPPPRLMIIGAVHVAVPLVRLAAEMGYRSIVIDPRSAFATEERFAHADDLIVEWPKTAMENLDVNESTCIVTLSHDPKIDLPALEFALGSKARYVGALGSKKTHATRVQALVEAGFDRADIARIHSPVGLDLGGRKAEEIALSIMAEIVAVSHGSPLGRTKA